MKNIINKVEILKRITKILILRSSFTNNLGLFNGKMGIIIYFFHLSEYLNDKKYRDFAKELIDEIYKEIHDRSPISFENGLAGIAWGIEYVVRNKFVKANTNDVLQDLDSVILQWDVRKVSDYSLETGLEGISNYIISRCANKGLDNITIPQEYIFNLINQLQYSNSNSCIELSIVLRKILEEEYINNDNELLKKFLPKTKILPKNIFTDNRVLGLRDGYAGIGLNLMI